jgi:hypothetical protein
MSTTFYAYTFVGVCLKDVLTEKEETSKIKRYSELTGEPYLKPVTEKRVFFGNKELSISSVEGFDSDDLSSYLPVRLFYTDHAHKYHTKYLGISLGRVDVYHNAVVLIDEDLVAKYKKELEEFLLSYGLEVKPQVFTLLHVSY